MIIHNTKHKYHLILLLLVLTTKMFAQTNLALLAHIPNDSAVTLAGCWHHVDQQGNEYALIGTSKGLDIWDVSTPAVPVRKFQVPGLPSNWREVKTWNNHAYVGSAAAGSGITIVDMTHLPDSIRWKVWFGDDSLSNKIQRSHTVLAQDDKLFVFGSTAPNDGAIICSIDDPWNPTFIGQYQGNYLHDGYLRGDTLWGSEIYAGQFSVIDISIPEQPQILAVQPTPGAFNHNTELSPDSRYLFTTDEKFGAPLGSFDVSELNNITLLDRYVLSGVPEAPVHNVRVKDDFLICPSYSGQISIVDASNPANLIEVAYDKVGVSLVWDANPYLPSGILFATTKQEGLFIYQPTYQYAARLEGDVVDFNTGEPISNVKIYLPGTTNADSSNVAGKFATGALNSGLYNILAEKNGYQPVVINNIQLTSGQTTYIKINMVKEDASLTQTPTGQALFTIAPTLVSDQLQIQLSHLTDWQLEISNLNGTVLLREAFSGQMHTLHIPEHWVRGLYNITVTDGLNRHTARFMLRD